MEATEAIIININTFEVTHPVHGVTSYFCYNELYSINYPFGTSFHHNYEIADKLIDRFVEVKNEKFRFKHDINLICRGSSGVIMATLFAIKLSALKFNPKIIYLPKDKENRHGGINFYPGNETITVIVDDFICSGETMSKIYEGIEPHLRGDKSIDFVCVTGLTSRNDLNFPVKYVICKELKT